MDVKRDFLRDYTNSEYRDVVMVSDGSSVSPLLTTSHTGGWAQNSWLPCLCSFYLIPLSSWNDHLNSQDMHVVCKIFRLCQCCFNESSCYMNNSLSVWELFIATSPLCSCSSPSIFFFFFFFLTISEEKIGEAGCLSMLLGADQWDLPSGIENGRSFDIL